MSAVAMPILRARRAAAATQADGTRHNGGENEMPCGGLNGPAIAHTHIARAPAFSPPTDIEHWGLSDAEFQAAVDSGWGFAVVRPPPTPRPKVNNPDGTHGFVNGVLFARWASKPGQLVTDETIAAAFGVCRATAYRWLKAWRELG